MAPCSEAKAGDEEPDGSAAFQHLVRARLQAIERKLDGLALQLASGRPGGGLGDLQDGLQAGLPGRVRRSADTLAGLRGAAQEAAPPAPLGFPQALLQPPTARRPSNASRGSESSSDSMLYPASRVQDSSQRREEPVNFHGRITNKTTGRETDVSTQMSRTHTWINVEEPISLQDSEGGVSNALTRCLGCFGVSSSLDTSSPKNLEQAQDRGLWRIVHGGYFQGFISFVIVLNIVLIGVVTNLRLECATRGETLGSEWDYVEVAFCVIFSLEIMLRALAERSFFILGPERKWNLFDTALVILSVIDTVLNIISNGGNGSVATTRTLRFVRFIRIMRIARAVRAFHSLRIVVFAIFESMLSLVWCFLVVCLIIYVFAVVFLQGVTEYLVPPYSGSQALEAQLLEYFGSVTGAMFTLFMTISGGVSWYDVLQPLKDIHWLFEPLFHFYVFFMVIGVLNVVVGAFVAATAEIANKDREFVINAQMAQLQAYMHKVKVFFQEADSDKSGKLSWEEFKTYLKTPQVSAYFRALELDVSQAHVLFKLLDVDNNDEVCLDEFLAGCMKLKGQAKSIDVNMLLYENQRINKRLMDFILDSGGANATRGSTNTIRRRGSTFVS